MRQRMTWGRKASAHPAYPDEGPASPAYPGADPEADAYENGDPSSWAEDPRTGPYAQGAHPATPDEGPASPAYNKQASLERKAAKCIRIASAMLGKKASVRQIEDQALVLMDLDNRAITATLSRLAEEEIEEEEEEEVEEAPESKKKASVNARLARLRRLAAEADAEEEAEDEEAPESKKKASFARRAGFDASTIGEEVPGPLEQLDSDEPWMGDHFTQERFEELRGAQQAGELGAKPYFAPNAKKASGRKPAVKHRWLMEE